MEPHAPRLAFNPMGHETCVEDLAALVRLLSILDPPRVVIEVGSWAGQSAIAMADGGADQVICVDTWEGNKHDRLADVARELTPEKIHATFIANCGSRLYGQPPRKPPKIRTCRMDSLTAAGISFQPAALIFIDAEHTLEACKADIQAWLPHLRPQGIVACHDYGCFDGVTQAVDELLPGAQLAGLSVAWKRIQ